MLHSVHNHPTLKRDSVAHVCVMYHAIVILNSVLVLFWATKNGY